MSSNQNLENSVKECNSLFADYFSTIGGRKFKQFYYDWHIDNMLAPFAGLAEYFSKQYGAEAPHIFHEFVEDIRASVSVYNVDKPQLSVLKNSKFSKSGDGMLSSLIDGVETFGFEFRQFMYNFADKNDHDKAFSGWPIKTNMPYSMLYGMMAAEDILRFLDKNYQKLVQGENCYEKALYAADCFMREKMAGAYRYNGSYNFKTRRRLMKDMAAMKERLYQDYAREGTASPAMKKLFQAEETRSGKTSGGYWPSGFELEFYVPEEYKDYGRLIDYLKDKNGWKKLYSTNKDAAVYHDENSAGVIMRDESLVRYNKLAAVEYASRILKSREDEESCLKIFDSFEQGHVNAHCSLHQHLSADGFDLDVYKRLVKRMMQHEEEVVAAFAAPERRENRLLYATYISRNLSDDGKRDYPFLCVMAELCEDKRELQEFTSFGHKYKTLNIMPEHTVEMRFMNANFNKSFVRGFLQFNREFVKSAAENSSDHVNRQLLNKYSWRQNRQTDTKTVMHALPYFYQYEYDSFHPQKKPVSKDVIEQEQKCWLLIMHALNETGKVPYVNAGFNKKFMEMKRNGR